MKTHIPKQSISGKKWCTCFDYFRLGIGNLSNLLVNILLIKSRTEKTLAPKTEKRISKKRKCGQFISFNF